MAPPIKNLKMNAPSYMVSSQISLQYVLLPLSDWLCIKHMNKILLNFMCFTHDQSDGGTIFY